MRRFFSRVCEFARREIVLVAALGCALLSCAVVPPDGAYAGYIDWRTISLLFCLMATVSGFRALGVLDRAATWLVARSSSSRALAFALVGLSFFASMAVTNDVALITFVPLALVTLRAANMEGDVCVLAALMTVAANLGSMFTPMGNPQNLYLFTASGMSVVDFLGLTFPYTLASAALLAVCVAVRFRRAPRTLERRHEAGRPIAPSARGAAFSSQGAYRFRLALFSVLFALCLLAVAKAVDVRAVLACVVVSVAIVDKRLFKRVDYALLATFAALFVFVGNAARMPLVHEAVAGLVDRSALLAAIASSQAISNVPAAVLLSGFTDRTAELIVGTNLGGLGTLIASMASLITFKAISVGRSVPPARYIATFTLVNVAFLAALTALALALAP